MAVRRRYYLGRVHKVGQLDDDLLIQAMEQPRVVHSREYAWTFTDAEVHSDGGRVVFAFAQLCKYNPSGVVRVIDEEQRVQGERLEPNLLVAASPFVYIPEFSGIAFQHVWNQIERQTFTKRFADVVRQSHDNFFLDCEIEPISDLRTFAAKLASIDAFLEIHAKVHPPNPLFGPAWANLKDYLARRAATELSLTEKGDEATPLRTNVAIHVQAILDQDMEGPYAPDNPVDVTDAAILMAADGYGSGKVVGREHDSTITVRTSETQKSFLFDAEPGGTELFEEACKHFSRVSSERRMTHE